MLSNYATYILRNKNSKIEYNTWEIQESGLLIGIALFSFESINTVVNVR